MDTTGCYMSRDETHPSLAQLLLSFVHTKKAMYRCCDIRDHGDYADKYSGKTDSILFCLVVM
jgi:hypothetical protein